MLDRLQTALQSVDSIQGQPIDWVWQVLSSRPLSSSDIEQSLSLLKKLKQLKLDSSYILSALLVLFFPQTKDLVGQEDKIPPLFLKHYQTLQHIFSFTPSLRNAQQEELFLKMLIAMTKDLQLLSSILAIQLLTLEAIGDLSEEKQRQYSQKILSVYAPLAERLGIFWIKSELEDIALRYVAPEAYYELKQKVAKKRNERSQMIDQITTEIRQLLRKIGIQHEVQGRYKRFYSIYQKLQKVDYDFDRIQDLTGFRILVRNIKDCYQALGYVHQHWSPKTGRFKDYISKPKPNGYRSLHTTVLDAKGESIEIQIRTDKMHQIAEFGVAAHWQYKKGANLPQANGDLYDNLRKKALTEFGEETHHSDQKGSRFYKNNVGLSDKFEQKTESSEQLNANVAALNIDFLENKIYVLTPQNDVIELPKDATPVDFAYAIHTKIGDHITAAKVNGKILKLDDALSNGNHVEVICSPKQTPRYEWLRFVKTSKAKNKIRHAVREKEREINKKVGWELLDKEFKRYGLNFNRVAKDGTLEKMVQQRKNQPLEQTVCAIGEGGMKAGEIVQWFLAPSEVKLEENNIPSLHKKKTPSSHERVGKYIIVEGMDNMLVRFAKCCSPEKGSEIYGYLTQGRGITIHRVDCAAFHRLDRNRRISVHWGETPTMISA